MRIFSLVSMLIAVLILGWVMSLYFTSLSGRTAMPDLPPAIAAPEGGTSAPSSPPVMVPVDRARDVTGAENERLQKMQDMLQ